MKKDYIQNLLEKTSEIESLVELFFEKVQISYSAPSSSVLVIGFSNYSWQEPTGEILKTQRELINKYEDWYSQSGQIISKLLPERRPDFVKLYDNNKKIIELEDEIWSNEKEQFKNDFLRNIGKQKSMIKSTLQMISNEPEKPNAQNEIKPQSIQNGIDISTIIDLKAQLVILSQQYSRIESDIKDLAQKVEGIGRITINNLNHNTAKTGAINISNENLIKWVKPELDEELSKLKEEINDKEIEPEEKQIIEDLIETILSEENPKIEWLKDKMKKIKYWGVKTGVFIGKIKELAEIFGITD